ncbi:MAG: CRISPR-associated protein Csx28 [Thiotrichaceae bacterium]
MDLSWFSSPSDSWATISSSLITGVATFLSVAIAAYLTYIYTRDHSHAVHNTSIRVDRLKRNVEALEHMWEALSYTSIGEGENAMIRWRKRKGTKVYFMHFGNLKAFLTQEMSEVFYKKHAGLYLSNNIRDQFFAYRRVLMGFYLRYEKDENVADDSLIGMENPELAEELSSMYDGLNNDLKVELNKLYGELLIK